MNLGEFYQPLLIFGGAYSNLDALKALKDVAQSLSISADHIICTGDIVAYCGQPCESVDFVQNWGIHVVMGNCEESFASGADDCGCGFNQGSHCDLLSVEWFNFANKKLNSKQREWFSTLPKNITLSMNEEKIHIVHGSVTSINQFIFPSTATVEFKRQFKHCEQADIIIAGHSGIPFTKHIGNRLWHNTGAIGMPANDATPRTWYSILYPEHEQIKLTSLSLSYNHVQAQHSMISAGLNNGYAACLSSGLWPSMDILPPHERRQKGIALTATTHYY